MSVPPDWGGGSLFSHGGTRAIREVLLPGRPSGGDPAVQPLDPDQGLSVAPTARLGQFELARGERQVLECPAQEHGRVDVSAAVAHTGQRRVDGGDVAALPASTPTEAARVWGRRRVGWVTATGSTRIRRAAPPVAAGKRVCDVLTCPRPWLIRFAARRPRLSLTTRTLPSLPAAGVSSWRFAFDSGSASTRPPSASSALVDVHRRRPSP